MSSIPCTSVCVPISAISSANRSELIGSGGVPGWTLRGVATSLRAGGGYSHD